MSANAAVPDQPLESHTVNGFLDKHYFMLRRLNSLLGIVPVGAFFLLHMLLNSRAGQGPEQYQWVPDTLDQIPFLIVLEVFGILLPILAHAVLGVWISTRADYHLPRATRGWYGNLAFQLQRWTGIALFFLIGVHVRQTWWQHQSLKLAAARGQVSGHEAEYDIYGSMNELLSNPLWAVVYVLFVLIAAWHFGNGIFNFAFKYGLTTSASSQRWAMAIGLGIALIGLILGLASIWGLTLSEWAQSFASAGGQLLGTR
jgi:succinate dehydrogenase / fumarate reductase, cytochrome b subunit